MACFTENDYSTGASGENNGTTAQNEAVPEASSLAENFQEPADEEGISDTVDQDDTPGIDEVGDDE